MGKLVKGKKIYYLEICFDDSSDSIEYVKEFIEGDSKCVTVGSVDMTDYWDDDTLFLLNDIDDVGIS
tara:strand:+ start:1041 stop:1241 length:201 start_codon:yes stop_codon:yes gene_type:complete